MRFRFFSKLTLAFLAVLICATCVMFISVERPIFASSPLSVGSQIVAKAQAIAAGKAEPGWAGGSVPYSWGGGHPDRIPGPTLGTCKGYTGPKPCNADKTVGVDCSGFTRWVYYLVYGTDVLGAGKNNTQRSVPGMQPVKTPQPGDLVFFGTQTTTYHIGIFIGTGQMIDAPKTGLFVQVDTIKTFGKVFGYYHYTSQVPVTPTPTTPPTSADWPMPGYDAAGTWYNTQEKTLSPANVKQLIKDWTVTISAPSNLSPGSAVVANGKLYIGSTDSTGTFYALDAKTGTLVWKFATGGIMETTSAVANGIVYVASASGLYALDATNGVQKWHQALVTGSPIVANGTVYVSGKKYAYGMTAFDAATGTKNWEFSTFGGVLGSPVVANGIVYITAQDETLYAINATTGKSAWSPYYIGTILEIAPTVANGVVYVGDAYGILYAVNAKTGKLNWQYTTGGPIDGQPAVANGVIYLLAQDLNLYAIDATTQKLLKKSFVGGEPFTSTAVANGVVYVSAATLDAIDATTLTTLWSYPLPNSHVFVSSPTVANGMVYGVSDAGLLYAFHL